MEGAMPGSPSHEGTERGRWHNGPAPLGSPPCGCPCGCPSGCPCGSCRRSPPPLSFLTARRYMAWRGLRSASKAEQHLPGLTAVSMELCLLFFPASEASKVTPEVTPAWQPSGPQGEESPVPGTLWLLHRELGSRSPCSPAAITGPLGDTWQHESRATRLGAKTEPRDSE